MRNNENVFDFLGFASLENGEIEADTFFRRRLPQSISTTFTDNESNIWLGTNQGLFRYKPQGQQSAEPPVSVYIRQVRVGEDSLLFQGTNFTKGITVINEDPAINHNPHLSFFNRSIAFGYAAQSYDAERLNEYQHFLKGFEKGWSDWSTESKKEYTKFPEGSYTFLVRTKDVYGTVSQPASYTFTITPTLVAYLMGLCRLVDSTGRCHVAAAK